jgi:hypothetical protein
LSHSPLAFLDGSPHVATHSVVADETPAHAGVFF